MRIGLIADTHIPWERSRLPPEILDIFRGVSLILHAGDIYAHHVLDELEQIAPVLAALGDDDYPSTDARIREKHILRFEGQTLWLIHERPLPLKWRQNGGSLPENRDGKPDIIVFGHEHCTILERSDQVLYINSGSPTSLNHRPGPGTVAIMELNSGIADVRFIQLQGE